MIRFVRCFICLIIMVAVVNQAVSAVSTPEGSIKFKVDGKVISFTESQGFPYISDTGRTMMPLRVCLDAIGCQVDWNQQTQTVFSRKGDREVKVPIGKTVVYKNGVPIATDTAAVVKNGRTYLPLRTILEAYGYAVDWDYNTKTVLATELTPSLINGGTTGIFARKQLLFEGFDGIEADVTLPEVTLADKGDCPYLYFGFDWKNDVGNVEGGFQFIEDPNHPGYNQWTVFMRQGNDWRWGDNIRLEQGSTHHIKFYCDPIRQGSFDLVLELDGKEVVRKTSAIQDFSRSSAKVVTAMAMLRAFDGENCYSKSLHSKITNLKASTISSETYIDFESFPKYQEWKAKAQGGGTWYGTIDCIPSYLHYEADGWISIYKKQ